MSNCFLWILLLCCCGKKDGGTSCGCTDSMYKKPCGCSGEKNRGNCNVQQSRPHCVMPADEKFICKADSGESFLDEKECE